MKVPNWLTEWLFRERTDFPTTGWDGIPWEMAPSSGRAVAIGDLHGDLDALATILEDRGLIDSDGNWRGGSDTVVLLGDLVGGHRDSRLLVELVLRIEGEAKSAGGQVQALIGNHDLLPCRGETKKMTDGERKQYRAYPIPGSPAARAKEAFRGTSSYARWLAGRNAILKVGDTLFVHGGMDRWALQADIGRVNATIRAWIKYWQGVSYRPPKETRWAVGADGGQDSSPLWMRTFKVRDEDEDSRPKGAPSRKLVRSILERLGARRIVLGHAPVPEKEILLDHPYYGESVILADTRVSDPRRGRLSAVEIQAGRVSVAYPKRRKGEHPVIERERERLHAGTGRRASGSWIDLFTNWRG